MASSDPFFFPLKMSWLLQKQFPKKNPFLCFAMDLIIIIFWLLCRNSPPKNHYLWLSLCVFFLGIFVCSQSGDHPYEEEEDVDKCGNHPS